MARIGKKDRTLNMDMKKMAAKKNRMRYGRRGEEEMLMFREGKRAGGPSIDLERSMTRNGKRVGENQFMMVYVIILGKRGEFDRIVKRKVGANEKMKNMSGRSWRRIV